MNVIILILNILGLIFLTRYVLQIIKEFGAAEDKRGFFTFRRFRHSISLAGIIGVPLLLANFILPLIFKENLLNMPDPDTIWWISAGLALLISSVWLIYVQQLDIYEPERWVYLLLTFALAGLSTWYLAGWMYARMDALGVSFYTSNSIVYDFLYCVFVIGGIEETCKILPVFLILIFLKKAINEPYDYILYGSVAALGFAFIENINYIYSSRLYNIGGRALYAVVAHMTFTSTLCYGLMLWRFEFTRIRGIIIIPLFFLMAMTAHGFYDFWLFNEWVVEYRAMTTVFFLVTVHLWVTMKNNALNVSNFYSPEITLSNDGLRYYLITSLAGLLMLGYLIVVLMDGQAVANEYLLFESLAYGYLVFYLAFGLSRYKIVPDEMNPFQVPFDFFVPKPVPSVQPEVVEVEEKEEGGV
jgi:RsiW-degrading membrane proteinase PrsW (M82 family)